MARAKNTDVSVARDNLFAFDFDVLFEQKDMLFDYSFQPGKKRQAERDRTSFLKVSFNVSSCCFFSLRESAKWRNMILAEEGSLD